MAYWLGFIIADGNIYIGNRNAYVIRFCLHPQDIGHIEKFKTFIGSNHHISWDKERAVYFGVSSHKMFTDLQQWGVKERKTYSSTSHISKIPDEYKSYFICGMFDGDGSYIVRNAKTDIYTYERCTIRQLSNYSTLEDVSKYLNKHHNISIPTIGKTKSDFCFRMDLHSKNNVIAFYNMYKESPVHLERKFHKITEFINKHGW